MKQDDRQSIFAWFEPSRGPCDIIGVRLAYIDPFESHFERALEAANQDKDSLRALNILHSKSYYAERKQKYFIPDAGWWMGKEEYISGRSGFGGATRSEVEEEYYSITLHNNREEAIKAAEKAGII